MDKHLDLTASIVTFKTNPDQLKKCLNSFHLFKGRLRIYIVDNSPFSELLEHVQDFDNIEYIHNPKNPGYGSGHNLAMRSAFNLNASYHLVINADVYFTSDIITPMLDYMNTNLETSMLMPKILNIDGSIQHLCKLVPTPIDLFARRFIPRSLSRKVTAQFEMHSSGYNKVMFVPYLSGCFMLLRKSDVLNVGLFDERFFMYPEDIDLTRRMTKNEGTKFFPHVSAYHEHGALSRKSLKMFLIHAYNICKYFNKWGWFYDPSRKALNKLATDQFIKTLK